MKKRSSPPARPHPDPRRADPQSQERLGLDSHRPADGRDGGLRVRQVLARLRHALRRGAAAIRGVALDLRAPVPGAPRPAGRRLDRAGAARDRPRAEERGPQRPLDGRHPDRDPRLAAPALRPRGHDVLLRNAAPRPCRGASIGPSRSCAPRKTGARATLAAPVDVDRAGAGEEARAGSGARAGSRPPGGAQALGLLPGRLARGRNGRDRATRSRRSWTRAGVLRIVVGRFVIGERSRPGDRLRRRDGVRARRHAGRTNRRSRPDVPPRTPLPALRPRVPRSHAAALFAFNSPLGACPSCQGFGRVIGVDLEKVIPDRTSDALRASGRALEHAGVRVRVRGPLPRRPALLRPDRRPGRAAVGSRAGSPDPGPRRLLRREGVLRLARDQALQDPRSRAAGAVPRVHALRRLPRGAPRARRRSGCAFATARSPSSRTCRCATCRRFFTELELSPAERGPPRVRPGGARVPDPVHERRRPRVPDAVARRRARSRAGRRNGSAWPRPSAAR